MILFLDVSSASAYQNQWPVLSGIISLCTHTPSLAHTVLAKHNSASLNHTAGILWSKGNLCLFGLYLHSDATLFFFLYSALSDCATPPPTHTHTYTHTHTSVSSIIAMSVMRCISIVCAHAYTMYVRVDTVPLFTQYTHLSTQPNKNPVC